MVWTHTGRPSSFICPILRTHYKLSQLVVSNSPTSQRENINRNQLCLFNRSSWSLVSMGTLEEKPIALRCVETGSIMLSNWGRLPEVDKVYKRGHADPHPGLSTLGGWWRKSNFGQRWITVRGCHTSFRPVPFLDQDNLPSRDLSNLNPDLPESKWVRTCKQTCPKDRSCLVLLIDSLLRTESCIWYVCQGEGT